MIVLCFCFQPPKRGGTCPEKEQPSAGMETLLLSTCRDAGDNVFPSNLALVFTASLHFVISQATSTLPCHDCGHGHHHHNHHFHGGHYGAVVCSMH